MLRYDFNIGNYDDYLIHEVHHLHDEDEDEENTEA